MAGDVMTGTGGEERQVTGGGRGRGHGAAELVRPGAKLVALALVLLAGVRACRRHMEPSRTSQDIVRDSAGVRITESAAPAWREGEGWTVTRLLTAIGAVEGVPESQLYQASSATRLSDGTVAVANGGTGEIRFFDTQGRFLRAAGRTGEGPGEFRREDGSGLRYVTHVEGDTLLAWDLLAQALSVFTAGGEFVRSIRVGSPGRMHFMRGILRDRSMLLALRDTGEAEGGWEGARRRVERLERFDVRADSFRLIGDFSAGEFYAHALNGGLELRIAPPWSKRLYVAAAGTHALVATGDSYEIAAYDSDGRLIQLIRRAYEPVPITDALAGEMVDQMVSNTLANAPRSIRETLVRGTRRALAEVPRPEWMPPYGGLLVDADLNVWVREFATSAGAPSKWSVFAAEGTWLGTVVLPAGLEPLEIGSDYALGREVDEMGVEYIKVYALAKGGADARGTGAGDRGGAQGRFGEEPPPMGVRVPAGDVDPGCSLRFGLVAGRWPDTGERPRLGVPAAGDGPDLTCHPLGRGHPHRRRPGRGRVEHG